MSTELSAPASPTPLPAGGVRPGWGVSVDLLPREIRDARHGRTHRRLTLLALVLVLLACGGVTLLAMAQRSTAEQDLADAQARTGQLRAEEASYGDVTTARRVLEQTTAERATLMSRDVDVVELVAEIRAALPSTMSIGNIAVLMAPPDPAAAAPTGDGTTVIGSVTISGSGQQIRDVAPFVSALNRLDGVSDVVPGSATKTDDGMDFAVSLNFTDALLSQRFSTEASASAQPTDQPTGAAQ